MARSHALSGIAKWVEGAEWRDAFATSLDEHFADVFAELDVEFGDLDELIGPEWTTVLWFCALEHFLTRPQGDDENTVVDDYLKRRGWKESVTNRRYMEALRDSVMSLHLVSDVVSGKSFVLRDVFLGGEPVRIDDGLASEEVVDGEHVAARVIEVSGRSMVSLGLLPMHPDTATEILEMLEREVEALERAVTEEAPPAEVPEGLELGPDFFKVLLLTDVAPLFASYWLEDMIGALRGGDDPDASSDLELSAVRFPLRDGAKASAVRERLNAVRTFRAEVDDVWSWIRAPGGERAAGKARPDAVARREARGDEKDEVLLGTVILRDGAVILATVPGADAAGAQDIIRHFADDLLEMPDEASSDRAT